MSGTREVTTQAINFVQHTALHEVVNEDLWSANSF